MRETVHDKVANVLTANVRDFFKILSCPQAAMFCNGLENNLTILEVAQNTLELYCSLIFSFPLPWQPTVLHGNQFLVHFDTLRNNPVVLFWN